MKILFSIIYLIFLVEISLLAQAPNWSWLERAGGNLLDVSKGIAVDQNGNILVTGYFQGSSFFDGNEIESSGSNDIFLAKYDQNFNLQWVKKAGGSEFDLSSDITVDAQGNSYVTGYFRGTVSFGDSVLEGFGSANIFLAKYAADGNLLWVRNAGGSTTNSGLDVVLDHAGDILMCGFFQATVTFSDTTITGNVSINIFLAKYNSEGTLLWVQQAGGNSDDAANGIAVDGENNIFVGGRISGISTFADTTLNNSTQSNIFISKYDPQGTFIWVRQAGGAAGDMATKVACDPAGNSYMTGFFSSQASFGDSTLTAESDGDVFVSKYDPQGNFLWVRQAGAGEGAVGSDIVVNNDAGSINIVGYFSDSLVFAGNTYKSAGQTDIFVAEYDMDGNEIWFETAGGLDGDTGEDIALQDGDIFVSGYFKDEVYFGDFEAKSSGSFEAFAAKMGSPVNDLEKPISKLASFNLMQNYPNPFNPETIINYELEIPNFVELVIYDIRGRSVEKLVNGFQNSGVYEVVFDGKGFSSGIYFYRLQTSSGFSETRKMILLK